MASWHQFTAKDGYIAGRPKAVCDRCGYQYRHDQLRKEWTALMVCSPCWDPPPPQLTTPRVFPEGIPIKNPRPEAPPVFITPMLGDGAGNAIQDGEGNALVPYPGILTPEPEDL
jgi:hypothetical protein